MNSEYLLLNAILTQGHATPAIKGLDSSFFKIEDNRKIYDFIVDYYMEYKKVPTTAIIQDKFPDFELCEEHGHVSFFVDELVENKYETRLGEILSDAAERLKGKSPHKPSEVADFVSGSLAKLSTISVREEDVDIAATSQERLGEYLKVAAGGGCKGIPFGVPAIDEVTGGMQKGQLIILMGLTGIGKSFFAVHLAKHAWLEGYKPLYVSLEMSSHQVALRFDALTTRLRHDYIKHGKLSTDEFEKYKAHLESINQGRPNFIVSNPSNCTQAVILAKIIETKPDICIIDYLSLMKGNRGEKDLWERLGTITADLKTMANDREINIPIVALAQVHRGFDRSKDVVPDLENVAHSFAIPAHADLVMAIHQNQKMYEANKMLLGLVKHRDGPIVPGVTLNWHLSESLIEQDPDNGKDEFKDEDEPF